MSPNKQRISVVIVCRNEEANIQSCINSILEQDDAINPEIILVDDGSTDNTIELAEKSAPSIRIISNPCRNLSKNRNIGWRATTSDLVCFLDADCIAPKNWLSTLTRTINESTKTAAAAGSNTPPDTTDFYRSLSIVLNSFWGSGDSIQGKVHGSERTVNHIPTLAVMYRKKALEEINGFDESFMRIGEDVDVSTRLRSLEYELKYTPDCNVIHRQRGTFRSWSKNMFMYGCGQSWLARKHPSLLTPGKIFSSITPLIFPIHALTCLILTLDITRFKHSPFMFIRIFLILLTTHLSYGAGQIYGYFNRETAWGTHKKKRVGLIALKNAGNKGDEAIVSTVAKAIFSHNSQRNDLYLLAFGPTGYTARYIDLTNFERVIYEQLSADSSSRKTRPYQFLQSIIELFQAHTGFNSTIIAGGQWLHDLKPLNHVIISGVMILSRLTRTKNGFFCIGAGPLTKRFSRSLVKYAFSNTSLKMVRDQRSLELLQQCGLNNITLGVDPVLNMRIENPVSHPKTVALSPCAWMTFDSLYTQDQDIKEKLIFELNHIIQGLEKLSYHILLTPTMNPEDMDICKELLDKNHSEWVELLDTPNMTYEEVAAHIGGCDGLVTMRLHPAIFAFVQNIPFISLNYADKVEQFCKDIDHTEYLISLENNWGQKVLSRFENIINNKTQIADKFSHSPIKQRGSASLQQLMDWLDS